MFFLRNVRCLVCANSSARQVNVLCACAAAGYVQIHPCGCVTAETVTVSTSTDVCGVARGIF